MISKFELMLVDMRSRIVSLERRMRRVSAAAPSVPTGTMSMFAGTVAPDGYLLAQGQAVQIADYPDLAAMLGTTWGSAPAGQVRLPDMRGRTPVGANAGDSDFGSLNAAPGAKTHTLTAAQMPSHSHRIWSGFGDTGTGDSLRHQQWAGSGRGYNASLAGNSGNPTAENTGGGGAHNNIQPSRVVNFIIKT